MSDHNKITVSKMHEAFKHQNAIVELSQLISERLWSDDTIKDRFVLAAFADAINSTAKELNELTESYLTDIK
jgi:hypothetical protein